MNRTRAIYVTTFALILVWDLAMVALAGAMLWFGWSPGFTPRLLQTTPLVLIPLAATINPWEEVRHLEWRRG